MPDGSRKYLGSTLNINGYTIMLPNVGEFGDLIQTFPPNPYAETSAQLFPLGTKLVQGERVWRYSHNASSTALSIAVPIQSSARVNADQDDNIAIGTASDIGDYVVRITGSTNLGGSPNDETDAFAEGYFYVNDEAGEGQCYKIKHSVSLNTTDTLDFTLYDPLTIALTNSSEIGLVKNPYDLVLAVTTTMTGIPVGIPDIAVTISYYFWSQTGGPCAVIPNTSIALGTMVVVGTTASKVDPMARYTSEFVIGYPLTPAINQDESFLCFLTLDS